MIRLPCSPILANELLRPSWGSPLLNNQIPIEEGCPDPPSTIDVWGRNDRVQEQLTYHISTPCSTMPCMQDG